MTAIQSLSTLRRTAILLFAFFIGGTAARAPLQAQVTNCVGGCQNGYSVQVTPDDSAASQEKNTVQTATFDVFNDGTKSNTFSLIATVSGSLTMISQSATSLTLNPDLDHTITVTYSVGSGSGGTVKLWAIGNSQDSGTVVVSTNIGTAPTVSLVVPTLTSGSRAIVRNRQPLVRAFITGGSTVDTAAISLKWRGTAVTSLARRGRRLIEWEVDSLHRLAVGDSSLIEVQACSLGGACSSWASRYAVLPNDSLPVLGFTGAPLEALGSVFSAPFGPGLSISGSEVETGFSTIPYISMDQPRSTGLVYSTRQSYPRALLPVDLELPWPSGTPDQVKLVVLDGATRKDSLVLTTPTCATGAVKRCRVTLPVDFSASTFSTPTRKWLKIEATVKVGATVKVSTDSMEAVLVDRRGTRYGSGWWPSGAPMVVSAGDDRVLVNPSGTATIFRGNGDSSYIAPPGNFTSLVKTGSGWELHSRGTNGKAVFDAQGRMVQAVDPNGNATTNIYNTTNADQVDSILDPLGFKIALTYSSGNLTTITSLTSTGTRNTAVSINGSNQLIYDSLSSPTAAAYTTRYVYTAFPGTNTTVLSKRIGVIADTTSVTYDSTFKRRPVSVRLPQVRDEANTLINPVIVFTAYEKQGYGALRSLDSVYVELKDPLNNWTRSLLNRWAQTLKSWDAIGVLGRSSFDPDGAVLWSEGKVADSSRTYFSYDASRRVAKSYIIRAVGDTLRGDSLVYDLNSRVAQRIDNRQKVWTTSYDTLGNVLKIIGPQADTSVLTYGFRGQLATRRLPGVNGVQRFLYNTPWLNLWRTVNEAGDTVATQGWDGYGRTTTSDSRITVKGSGGTAYFQWRHSAIVYNSANQPLADSLRRSGDCSPCSTLILGPLDDAHLQTVVHTYDRGGRDSLRTNAAGGATAYLYDRLGRLVVRRPWSTMPTVRDSMAYNAAGVLRKSFNRRGDSLITTYDNRYRDTLTVVSNLGSYHKSFSGPGDELTRSWLTPLTDPIGGVNGERRWGYDQRGRLKADTVYTGATARSTTYSYDTWERPSTITDMLGTWTTRYETARGMADTLLTPFADTIRYTFDVQGRRLGPTVQAGANPSVVVNPVWTPTGQLDSLTHWVGATLAAKYARTSPSDFYNDDGKSPALNPSWHDPAGASWQDSVAYDGWERVTAVTRDKNGAMVRSEQYSYDATGNLHSVGDTSRVEVYDGQDRLVRQKAAGVTDTLIYDAAGNLIRRAHPGHAALYSYDPLNRLIQVQDSTSGGLVVIARYGYDVLGRRIAKRVYSAATGGAVGYTRFVYHGSAVAVETDSVNTLGLRYTWGAGTDDLIGVRTAAGSQYYVVQDKLGSVRGVVKRDGTITLSLSYSPYGEQIDSTGTGIALRYKWTGREYDAETGWYYFRARYYSPTARRFVQEDPIGYQGGGNLYAYAGGRVLEATDPSGKRQCDSSKDSGCPGFGAGGPPDPFEVGSLEGFGNDALAEAQGEWNAFDTWSTDYYLANSSSDIQASACPASMQSNAKACDNYNHQQLALARQLLATELNAGNPGALSLGSLQVNPVSGSDIANQGGECSATLVACTVRGQIYINADLIYAEMAALLTHEMQHILGEMGSGRGSPPSLEACAQLRATTFIGHMQDQNLAQQVKETPYFTAAWNQTASGCGFTR